MRRFENIKRCNKVKKQRDKKVLLLLVVLCVMTTAIIYYYNYQKIPKDYIAIFHGGSGEVTYSTYVYHKDNLSKYKYINTTNSTDSWGSTERKIKVTKRGKVTFANELFKVAEENGAYRYVKFPNDNKIYPVEEFIQRLPKD